MNVHAAGDQAAWPAGERPLRRPVDEHTLRQITERIVRKRPDSCVVLFGSLARGQPRAGSDVDLLVVTQTDEDPLRVAGELYYELRGRDFAIDLVVITPERLKARLAGFDPFLRDVLAEGRVLHGQLG